MAVRRIGDTGIFTSRRMRLPDVYQHESYSLDASHNPYQRRMRSFRDPGGLILPAAWPVGVLLLCYLIA
jgi:hypothetical protein